MQNGIHQCEASFVGNEQRTGYIHYSRGEKCLFVKTKHVYFLKAHNELLKINSDAIH